jgi:hypothetical protein
MTDSEKTLTVSETNCETSYAVQGESGSRKLTIHLVEEKEIEENGQTATIEVPLDLTGCRAKLLIDKPDRTQVFIEGDITDPIGNTIIYILPDQALTAGGTAACTVAIIGPDSNALKAVGLSLVIANNDMEKTLVSTSAYVGLVDAMGSIAAVQNATDEAISAANTANNAVNDMDSHAKSIIESQKDVAGGIAAYDTFKAHSDNTNTHITADERGKWNNACAVEGDFADGKAHYKFDKVTGIIEMWGIYREDIAFTSPYPTSSGPFYWHPDTNDTAIALPYPIQNANDYYANIAFSSSGILFGGNCEIENTAENSKVSSKIKFRCISGMKTSIAVTLRWRVIGKVISGYEPT